jgi:hypothetical protein
MDQLGNARDDDSPEQAVVNGRAIAGRQLKREGFAPLVKISHAEMMRSVRELKQDCQLSIRNRLER